MRNAVKEGMGPLAVKKIVLLVVILAIAAGAYSFYLSQSDDPGGIYDIEVSVNNPDAGTVSTCGGQCMKGEVFTCSVRATADGYTFDGWFDGDVLRCSSETYTFVVGKHVSLEARYSEVSCGSFTVTPSYAVAPAVITMTSVYDDDVVGRTWLVTDIITGEVLVNRTAACCADVSSSFCVTEGRALRITHTAEYSDGTSVTDTVVKIVDEVVTKHFSWRYQKGNWSIFGLINNMPAVWDPQLSFAWYYNSLTSPLPRDNGFHRIGSYVTHNDPTIRSLALDLKSSDPTMDDLALANYILKFVQSIPYEYDIDGKGVDDYWKLPA
ncbi:MAG: hypothetical protein LBH69_04950 [Methanomassiliicoccaceae archaeon]|jgi:uncharacterized repeat protein (TIGR02543 family)|nr:hypothetical protein [Methanomassiliicoccaceae archaeon]